MEPLRERFLLVLTASMAELAEFRFLRGEFEQGAARAYNEASQLCYKHPWGSSSDAFPEVLLPGLVGNLFELNGIALRHDGVRELAMQALAMGRELAFSGRFPSSRFLIVLAVVPVFLLSSFEASFFIVVVRIGRSSLAIHLALQAAKLFALIVQLLTKDGKVRFSLLGHDGDGRGAEVQATVPCPTGCFGFWKGCPPQPPGRSSDIPGHRLLWPGETRRSVARSGCI